ncbi:ATP-binding protein [Streptomyces sp. NPDC048507]|uniref:ATP-binding protein n=1 Tax=Streptomyces sp. NPDC048507 TaxID=3365560 RepID=UPI00371D51F7
MDRTDGTQGQPDPGEKPVDRPTGGRSGPSRPSGPSWPPVTSALAARSAAGAQPAPAPARIVTLTSGDFTLTVNPVDGSEIENLRPGAAPAGAGRPARRDAAARADRDAAARPPVLPGPPLPVRPSAERAEERDRIVRLLGRGRSVRLTGTAGSGRTTLLDAVAAACSGLAPDGVVRLGGHGVQQPAELLHSLYAAVYEAPGRRPDRTELLARTAEIGAIVLLDDLELGGAALDELLRATPECAYLLAAAPDAKSPSDDAHLEEVFLDGLGKADCLLLLEAGAGRPLTEEETAWAGDLRFASEGLPLRFVQAGALLRQRDELNRSTTEDEDEEPGVFEERPRDAAPVPLPTLAEGAAPAELLASRASESARAALRIACALGGELPHHAHLPALVGDTHADTAVAELLGCGLITPVGPRYRLAEGVARQLEEAGYGDTAAEEARTAARHYAWWTGHASVTPERVAAEADAVLAALAGADVVAAVLLARTAAPAFAASLHWEAWERVLRAGAEAARKAGEVAEQAYFHHELGVLALCEGRLERARAELEASIGLRGALADKRGTVAGRRALALVTDREALGVEASPPLRLAPPALGGPPAPGGSACLAGSTAPGAAPVRGGAAAPGGPAALGGASGRGGAAAPGGPAALGGAPGLGGAAALGGPAGLGGASGLGGAPGLGGAAGLGGASGLAGASGPGGAAAPGGGRGGTSGRGGAPGPSAAVTAPLSPITPVPALPPVSVVKPEPAALPALPAGSEAVTRVTPVIGGTGPVPPALSQAFEDAFPQTPQASQASRAPRPEPLPGRPAAGPAGRRKTVLLAAAGALTVVALGTVVGLALASGDEQQPAAPAVSSTPDAPAVVPPQVPGNNGDDAAPQPAASGPSAPPTGKEQPGQRTPPARTTGPSRPPATDPGPKPTTKPPTAPVTPQPPTTTPPVHPPTDPPVTDPPPVTGPPTPPATSTSAQSPTAAQPPSASASA